MKHVVRCTKMDLPVSYFDDQEEYPVFAKIKCKRGNSLACLVSDCPCVLLLLKRLGVYFPVVITLLRLMNHIREYHVCLERIDRACWRAA